MSSKVSIIIPVFNTQQYLRECLDSAVNQTLTNIEIICIDDGSTDSSGEICDEYAAKDSRFVVIHQPNSGHSVARNKGIEIARGEYITFLDSDDILHLDYCRLMLDKAITDNADYVSSFSPLKSKWKMYWRSLWYRSKQVNSTLTDKVKRDFCAGVGGVWRLIKKSLIQDNHIRFHSGNMFEDGAFFIECLAFTDKTSILFKQLYFYRQRNNSVVKQNIHILDFIKNYAAIYDFLEAQPCFSEFKTFYYSQKWEFIASLYRRNQLYKELIEKFIQEIYDNATEEEWQGALIHVFPIRGRGLQLYKKLFLKK